MTQRNDGGPAYPSVCMGDPGHQASIPGMSLRDWLAGQALMGLLAGGQGIRTDSLTSKPYEIADEMLKAREK